MRQLQKLFSKFAQESLDILSLCNQQSSMVEWLMQPFYVFSRIQCSDVANAQPASPARGQHERPSHFPICLVIKPITTRDCQITQICSEVPTQHLNVAKLPCMV